MLTTFVLLLAVQATPAAVGIVSTTLNEPDVPHMKPIDIKTFNQLVPANHPYYIRCRSELILGSLVKRFTACKTNQQWAKADQVGNDDARDLNDRMASKFGGGN